MWMYVARRLLYSIPILFGVLFLTFMIFFFISSPEQLAAMQLGKAARPDSIAAWMRENGYATYSESGREKLGKADELDRLSAAYAAKGEEARTVQRQKERETELATSEGIKLPAPVPESGHAALMDMLAQLPEVTAHTNLLAAQEAKKKELDAIRAALKPEKGKQPLSKERETELKAAEEKLNGEIESMAEPLLKAAKAAADARLAALKSFSANSIPGKPVPEEILKSLLVVNQHRAAEAEFDLTYSALHAEEVKLNGQVEALIVGAADTEKYGMARLFVTYVKDLLTFNFGQTNQKRPVGEVLSNGIWPSLKLMLPAFLLTEILAVSLALFAALYRGTKVDRTLVIISVFLMSFSAIALVMIIQKVVAADWGYFPIAGYTSGIPGYVYLILPILLYAIISVGGQMRFDRILMLDEVGQDYVRTAKAKGLGQNTILFKHVLRNAMIPLITRWAVVIPNLYLGSLVLESFFGIPGLGGITVQAVTNRDPNMIRALVFIGTLIYIFSTLLADVLYAVVDPRVKLK